MAQSKHPSSDRITAAATASSASGGSVSCGVVGIGASAGGLAAFEAFFASMPADAEPSVAFVLVQHLAPDHDSMLAELLDHHTRLPVVEATDGMLVRPGWVYTIPPDRDIALRGGALRLLDPPRARGLRLPINFFFRSLAEELGARAVCVVLSGAGSDGTEGARAVKAAGGLVVAQSPESADFDSMPSSVIGADLADLVLAPGDMLPRLLDGGGPDRAAPAVQAPVASLLGGALPALFALLRARTSHDFSPYKLSTIGRRIERRMAANLITSPDEYVRFCQRSSSEVDALFRDLLIGVTQFFRDGAEFASLEREVIPRIFADKQRGATVRAWVPGCSTGEEAYSIAMLLQEHRDQTKADVRVQVFATDLSPHAVRFARTGLYPESISAAVSPARLARFFQPVEGRSLRIEKRLRDLVVFSEQDVLKDPPFSRLDLLSCRNLLIYLGPEAQRRLLRLFHYALAPGGFLFLGASESLGEVTDRFVVVDAQAKLYQRRDGVPEGYHQSPAHSFTVARVAPSPIEGRSTTEVSMPLREITERALLQHVQAVAALVDERGELRYLHGRSGRFLEPAPGLPGASLLDMAREGLRVPLAVALHEAVARREPQSHPGLLVKTNGDYSVVDLTVRPITPSAVGTAEVLLLVVFEEARATEVVAAAAPVTGVGPTVATLQEQLRAKDEYLHSSVEALEIANEELQSANEELQSTNEELQSTNEELETSKEELQSVNEELETVNHELHSKVTDLAHTTNDMSNLLASTEIGTVFVDHDLLIRRFTPSVTQVMNLIATDVGRPVAHMASNLVGYDTLVDDVRAVLETLVPREIEVQSRTGAWFLLRVRPYRTVDNVIEGAVITFVDITELKHTRTLAREGQAARHLAAVVRDATDAVMMLDPEGRILAWNPASVLRYGWTESDALGLSIRDVTSERERSEAIANIQRISRAAALEPYATERLSRDGAVIPVWIVATALLNEAGETYAYATTERPRSAP